MSNTSAVYARIDPQLKQQAEGILSQLGISPSGAVQMLYRQIVLQRGLPLDLHLPPERPLAAGSMSREEMDAALTAGVESIRKGQIYTAREVRSMMAKEYANESIQH